MGKQQILKAAKKKNRCFEVFEVFAVQKRPRKDDPLAR
jgi:hypothetical protein